MKMHPAWSSARSGTWPLCKVKYKKRPAGLKPCRADDKAVFAASPEAVLSDGTCCTRQESRGPHQPKEPGVVDVQGGCRGRKEGSKDVWRTSMNRVTVVVENRAGVCTQRPESKSGLVRWRCERWTSTKPKIERWGIEITSSYFWWRIGCDPENLLCGESGFHVIAR